MDKSQLSEMDNSQSRHEASSWICKTSRGCADML